MKSAAINLTPSIHIQRDLDKSISYIVTPNAKQVFDQIIADFQQGIHAFTLIGSYGTGKSAFLVALSQSLLKHTVHFSDSFPLSNETRIQTLPLVGSFQSFYQAVNAQLPTVWEKEKEITPKTTLKKLKKYYNSLQEKKQLLLILVDEFGKYLEFAAQHNPDKELYFIQQLAEYVQDKNILLITTLHQNFAAYAYDLSKKQYNEWVKVKGRLKELTFNEPVEQLLLLAAQTLEQQRTVILGKQTVTTPYLAELTKVLVDARAIPLKGTVSLKIVEQLYPLDLLSASILTLALQKYGQNERSLFSFLQGSDLYGLQKYDKDQNLYYNASCVYDYLMYNFYSFLSTKYNPHYTQWIAIHKALERAEAIEWEQGKLLSALQLIKTIGLLNIFAPQGSQLNLTFLEKYARYSLGIEEVQNLVAVLLQKKIILYKKYKKQYILFEGTDFDIELALLQVNLPELHPNAFVAELQQYFTLPYLPAKAIHYQKGTPRFFQFELSPQPINKIPNGAVDGFINLILPIDNDFSTIIAQSKATEEAILYAYFTDISRLKKVLTNIRKLDVLLKKGEVKADKIAHQELSNLRTYEIQELNHQFQEQLWSANKKVQWLYKGEVLPIYNQKTLNQTLSRICAEVYAATPVYKNELMNRTKLSPSITTARRHYFRALTTKWNQTGLGFPDKKFPPEKTIYLSLLQQTGIHQQQSPISYTLTKPTATSFEQLWAIGERFLESAKINRKNLTEFENILSKRPLKLKKGFIDFWLPTFLFINRDAFALFKNGVYVPQITSDEIDLMYRRLKDYQIKTFNVSGIRLDLFNQYRQLLQLQQTNVPAQQSFIETIRPFLIFYKQLPNYTRQTKRLQKHTLQLRNAIATAKDPEQSFFETFPKALGYHNIELLKNEETDLQNYVHQLQSAIRELRTTYDELLNRVEAHLITTLGLENNENNNFKQYRQYIEQRYSQIKKHLLLPHQKTLFARLHSPLNDRNAWLKSVATVLLRKDLMKISDQEELILYEKMTAAFHELDNLCSIHQLTVDAEKEEVIKIDITTVDEGTRPYQVRLSKAKALETKALQDKMKALFGKDERVNRAVLIGLLREMLE